MNRDRHQRRLTATLACMAAVAALLPTGCATARWADPAAASSDTTAPAGVEPADRALPTPPPSPAQASTGDVLDVGPGRIVALAPGPSAVARSVDVQPAAGSAATHHVVRPGESLFAIARARLGDGGRWREIAAVNPGLSASNLKAGQRLRLP